MIPNRMLVTNISTIENAVQQMLRVKKQALRRSPRTSPQHLANSTPDSRRGSLLAVRRNVNEAHRRLRIAALLKRGPLVAKW
ncbi:hypothetical protein CEXT_750761 [Caerostris extrusa]|uniref:Uncharacterized protein n=1 Tax=Caerostris extrusa TaxID=172846 RepID=A0AAV4WU27_CAEEX|nr:hypothetical protein CEXT_750761 [Caerostris extrusa]